MDQIKKPPRRAANFLLNFIDPQIRTFRNCSNSNLLDQRGVRTRDLHQQLPALYQLHLTLFCQCQQKLHIQLYAC